VRSMYNIEKVKKRLFIESTRSINSHVEWFVLSFTYGDTSRNCVGVLIYMAVFTVKFAKYGK
jgi:hypothetical protein